MPTEPSRNEEVWERLQTGEPISDIIAAGFAQNTVYRINRAVERGELSPLQKKQAQREAAAANKLSQNPRKPSTAPQNPKDVSATIVRMTQEQIVLPGAMFMLYDHCKLIYPEYTASKSQWIMDCIRCWAQDHAGMLQLNPMTWAHEPEVQQEDGLDTGQLEDDAGGFYWKKPESPESADAEDDGGGRVLVGDRQDDQDEDGGEGYGDGGDERE